jgi:hypothetical protein
LIAAFSTEFKESSADAVPGTCFEMVEVIGCCDYLLFIKVYIRKLYNFSTGVELAVVPLVMG